MSADRLYRYISFFDLYNLLERKFLRVSQVTKFDDKNEGFGFVLRSLDVKHLAPLGVPACFYGPRIAKTLSTLSYVSCWTTEPEKIAMWQLYSIHLEGFRIRSTREKLKCVLTSYRNSYDSSPDKIESFAPRSDGDSIINAEYINFRKTMQKLEARDSEIEKIIDEEAKRVSVKSFTVRVRALSKVARESMKTLKYIKNPWSYKDEAYDHESEVRAVVEFEPCDEEGSSLLDDLAYGRSSDLFDKFPPFIQMRVCDNFIEEICIDQRCDEFKKEVYRSFISKYGYSLSESHAFSSLFDESGLL
jgi:hypothetical protein